MSTSQKDGINPRRDISLFHDYKERARQERAVYLRELASNAVPSVPTISPGSKRSLGVFATALAVATAAFWAIMLTAPPQTEASNVEQAAKPSIVGGVSSRPATDDRCQTGTDASNFACRNTWMGQHRYSYR